MQLTHVRSKKRDYDMYLKSENCLLFLLQLEARKNFSPAILKWEKLVPSYFEPEKLCRSYLKREKMDSCYFETNKCSSQLLGARKKIMTSI